MSFASVIKERLLPRAPDGDASDVDAISPQRVIAASVGFTVPLLLGLWWGQPGAASVCAVGAMMASGLAMNGPARLRLGEAGATVASCAGVGWLGATLSEPSGAHVAVELGVVFLLALAGGFSIPTARFTSRCIVFLIIGSGIGRASEAWQMGVLFAVGAAATLLIAESVLVAMWLYRLGFPSTAVAEIAGPRAAARPLGTRLRAWRGRLEGWSGWQFPVRLTLCFASAYGVEQLLHQREAYWITLTVAIVLKRRLATGVARVWQRSAGTALGTAVGGLLLAWTPPAWLLALFVGLVAGVRPVLKTRNYLLYASVMTPMIFLVLDLGLSSTTADTVAARLIDTVLGSAIAFVGGYALWWWLPQPPRSATAPAPGVVDTPGEPPVDPPTSGTPTVVTAPAAGVVRHLGAAAPVDLPGARRIAVVEGDDGRTDVAAPDGATVTAVLCEDGDRVVAGQPLFLVSEAAPREGAVS